MAETTQAAISCVQESSLRSAALWYSAVPNMELCLNEEPFNALPTSASEYRPLSWTLFGGLGGMYLRHLTKMAIARCSNLEAIFFDYDTGTIPRDQKVSWPKPNMGPGSTEVPINGPGGEIITTIAIAGKERDSSTVHSCYKDHTIVGSFQVSTIPPNPSVSLYP